MRVAYEIVLDKDAGRVEIDGVPFPYYVASEVEVVGADEQEMLGVTVTVYAENVTVRGHALNRHWSMPFPLRAARMRARNIVRDGLSDALPWLRHAREEQP